METSQELTTQGCSSIHRPPTEALGSGTNTGSFPLQHHPCLGALEAFISSIAQSLLSVSIEMVATCLGIVLVPRLETPTSFASKQTAVGTTPILGRCVCVCAHRRH